MITHTVKINGIEVTARYSESAVNGIFLPLLIFASYSAPLPRLLPIPAAASVPSSCIFMISSYV